MLEEKYFVKIERGLINISTNSFFNFVFPQIISNGNNTHPVVIFKGNKKYILVCLVAFRDAMDEIMTIDRNNAEPNDIIYLLLIEATLLMYVEDWSSCPCFSL